MTACIKWLEALEKGSLIGDLLFAGCRVSARRLESVCCLKHLLTYALISLSLCRRNSLTSHPHPTPQDYIISHFKVTFCSRNIIQTNFLFKSEELQNKLLSINLGFICLKLWPKLRKIFCIKLGNAMYSVWKSWGNLPFMTFSQAMLDWWCLRS